MVPTSSHPLTGKNIEHKFDDGIWYSGKVISQVPWYPVWYNVVYDNDESIFISAKDRPGGWGPNYIVNSEYVLIFIFSDLVQIIKLDRKCLKKLFYMFSISCIVMIETWVFAHFLVESSYRTPRSSDILVFGPMDILVLGEGHLVLAVNTEQDGETKVSWDWNH